ncbi:hypothetical protein AB6A40_006007 [Gnathostoma spinigerum]|uniref:Transmembrane protein 186 n=1 Tax=Gnathostoma spinigerum TaxID=75299 RepID=A0ABD6EH44_9BILA
MVLLQGLVLGKTVMNAIARRGTRPIVVASTSSFQQPSKHTFRARKRPLYDDGVNPYSKAECLSRLGGNCIRNLRTVAGREVQNLEELLKDENWLPVYRFEGIRVGVLLARAKLIQTLASVLFVPYVYYQYLSGSVSLQFFGGVTFFALSATATLLLFSRYFNRMIGVISMNETNDYIRVGYLSFWGSRRNRFVALDDTLPLREANYDLKDTVAKFRQFSTNSFLYLPMSNVELVDEERAALLFGDISCFSLAKKNQ